jgi:hypothetical protein
MRATVSGGSIGNLILSLSKDEVSGPAALALALAGSR